MASAALPMVDMLLEASCRQQASAMILKTHVGKRLLAVLCRPPDLLCGSDECAHKTMVSRCLVYGAEDRMVLDILATLCTHAHLSPEEVRQTLFVRWFWTRNGHAAKGHGLVSVLAMAFAGDPAMTFPLKLGYDTEDSKNIRWRYGPIRVRKKRPARDANWSLWRHKRARFRKSRFQRAPLDLMPLENRAAETNKLGPDRNLVVERILVRSPHPGERRLLVQTGFISVVCTSLAKYTVQHWGLNDQLSTEQLERAWDLVRSFGVRPSPLSPADVADWTNMPVAVCALVLQYGTAEPLYKWIPQHGHLAP